MAEYPSLPLFTDAYMADTRHLTTMQHGAYLLMLMTAWRMPDCALPNDDIFLSRITGMDKRTWGNNKGILLAFWDLNKDAKLFQKRLKDERNYVEQLRNKNVAAGKASVLKRNERHSTTVSTKRQPNVNPHTHTHSKREDTNVSSTPISPKINLPDWLPISEWNDWIEMRQKIPRSPFTEKSKSLALDALSKIQAKGYSAAEILNTATMNSWKSFYEPMEDYNGYSGKGRNGTEAAGNGAQLGKHSQPESKWITEGNRLAAKYGEQARVEAESKSHGGG